MLQNLSKTIQNIKQIPIPNERIEILNPLANYLQNKVDSKQEIRLNFICTHNSRRSHLAQVWAQTMAFHFNIQNVFCYSGGTETTAMFPKIAQTLTDQGFQIQQLSQDQNPIYAIKFSQNQHPIICFSKNYFNNFNPQENFAAILACNHADQGCPIVIGAENRFAIQYEDPKIFDNTPFSNQKYSECSLQIAAEMYHVFSKINKK